MPYFLQPICLMSLLFFLYSVYMMRFTTSGVSPPSSFSFTNMRSSAAPPIGFFRSQSSISMESCAGSFLYTTLKE